MKTIRILFIGIIALALALASGSAEAAFILKVEDPALPDGVLEVVDNGDGDTNVLDGAITTLIDVGGISTIINALSKIDRTTPRIVLDLEGYQTFSDSVKFSVTDTDFTVAENTPGRVLVWGVQDAGNSSSFTFAGDTDNGEFVEGFILKNYNETEPEYELVQEGSVPAVGSLTLSGVVEKGTNVEEVIETTFSMILQVGQSTARDCPPTIGSETISRLGTIGDGCVIQNSTIEDGDVIVENVGVGFIMNRSVVRNGDINIENVEGLVELFGNRVTNGGIEIEKTDFPSVTYNVVNGPITIRENNAPIVHTNIFSNANMDVRDNTGTAEILRNVGVGSANLEVDENATVVVKNNTTNRDITCEDNEDLLASGNEADRRLECPKEEGLFD